jgi:hypothetical protein
MAQVTIGGSTYNSFESVADADVFLAGDVLRATPWALRNSDAKARGLVSATRLLVRQPWCGPVPAFDAVPDPVKEATAMLAADMLAKPKLFADASANSNVKSAKAGSAQVEFFSAVKDSPPLPRAIWDMLTGAGILGCVAAGTGIDTPFVSGANSRLDTDRDPFGYGWLWPYDPYADDQRTGGW